MSINIDSIKRKLLIKYPTFGSVIAKLDFRPDYSIDTAGTDGKKVLYNPKFVESLSSDEQIFLFAHEVCHVAFEHIYRREGKDKNIWNKATDAVINALLQQDGLPMIEGGVDIPEAVNYDAEEMYQKLLEEKQSQQNSDGKGSNESGSPEQNSGKQQDVGHDTHDLWDKAIEDMKKEQDETGGQKDNETKNKKQKEKSFAEKGEQAIFKQNAKEKKKQLQKLSKELASKSSQEAGHELQREGKQLSDIGIATPLIDWRKLLRQAVKYDEEWTRKNARMRNGYFRHKVEQVPMPEAEILLDVSGSVSEILLKNFLRECKNILDNSKVKVGCFNEEFHGFTELRRPEDIDNMSFPIGGGTNFDVAVGAFSRRVPNKIIFTDGEANMPKKEVRNVIWVVFGDEKINPKGGKIINITGEQLKRLYEYVQENKNITR